MNDGKLKNLNVLVIAEAGVNHNGSLDLAKKLIDVAYYSGADYVKFKTFTAEAVVSKHSEKANYQLSTTDIEESQFEMIKKLELDRNAHEKLIQYCSEKGIQFLSTAFDHDSIDLLAELNIPFYKIPSGEITNLPYLLHIGNMKKPIIYLKKAKNLKNFSKYFKPTNHRHSMKLPIKNMHSLRESP